MRKNDFENADQIKKDFKELHAYKIRDLPMGVKALRLNADDTQEHIGHHIALLWEDPYLRPPQMEYTPA